MRDRKILALVVAVLIVGTLGWWGYRTYLPAVEVSGGGLGVGSAPGRPAIAVGLSGCLDGDGKATIVGVRPARSTGGMRVTAFATNPSDADTIGFVTDPVSRLPAYSSTRITTSCGEGSRSIAIQVEADRYPATARSFDVDYTVRGLTRTATANASLVLYRGPLPEDDCQGAGAPTYQDDCELSKLSTSW